MIVFHTTVVNVPYWWHASLLEILWLTGGIGAAALTGANLVDAWKDTEILDEIRFDATIGPKHYEMIALSAHSRLESQIFRFVVALLIVFAGIVGVVVANPLGGATTLTGFTVSIALVGISILTATKAMLDLVNRNRLYELARGRSMVMEAEEIANPADASLTVEPVETDHDGDDEHTDKPDPDEPKLDEPGEDEREPDGVAPRDGSP